MSEPAKDETDLVQCMAKAMHDSVYGGESAWMDVSKIEQSYREMEADAALAAIRAAGWAVVPVEPTREMLRAGYDESGGRAVIGIWEAMLETAPGVKP
jgi:hypothetical protein